MPSKSHFPKLPHLDPQFSPEHPQNRIPDFSMAPGYLGVPEPQSPKEIARLEREWLEREMLAWSPPHVVRSWETDEAIANLRQAILRLKLKPRVRHPLETLSLENKMDSSASRAISSDLYDPEDDPDKTDFRYFAHKRLHLGYHRFHASHGEDYVPSEETDPNIPEEDICWIMEYTTGECATIRRTIASMMGLYPVVIDKTSIYYDYIQEGLWQRRAFARCRRQHRKCVRPAHIIITGANFEEIP